VKSLKKKEPNLDFNLILKKTVEKVEISTYKDKLDAQKHELTELHTQLNKHKDECEKLKEENKALSASLKETLKKLNSEISLRTSLEENVKELENSFKKLQIDDVSPVSKSRNEKKNSLVIDTFDAKSTDDAKMEALKSVANKESLKFSYETEPRSRAVPIPPPPPPPPRMYDAPPSPNMSKKIPKCETPMKCFNWNKISQLNYDNTLWKNVNEEKLYSVLDLKDFQRTFSAYQKPQETDASNSEHPKATKLKKEFSVIDSRRAHNCTILLSKLRMTNDELINLILNMDPNDELPKDMIEQLLKFIPTMEEETLLEENRSELANMTKADRFLYDMSKVFRYKQKLESLNFKKKYVERQRELSAKLTSIIDCCKRLRSSQSLVSFLEIVLALGNFMNQSHRKGVALGFSIANLNKLIDIKSSNDRSFSFLHFLINTIQEKFPQVLQLNDEVSLVNDVSKINLETLEYEWSALESGFFEFEKELNVHNQNSDSLNKNDEFINLTVKFINANASQIQDLKKKFSDMKNEYLMTIKYFAEDPKTTKFEEFFTMWNTFIQSFSDVKTEVKQKKQREIEERKAKESELIKTAKAAQVPPNRQLHKRVSNYIPATYSEESNEADFDDLLNAIQSGKIYKRGDRRNKMPSTSTAAHLEKFTFHRERMFSQD